MEKMEEIYKQLSEENKTIINMVAQGMKIAEQNSVQEVPVIENKK